MPALAYVVQNNLLLVAADNLEGPVLALFGQLKILTTALFSVTMLRRTLGARCWFALVALTLGIATVQVSQIKPAVALPRLSLSLSNLSRACRVAPSPAWGLGIKNAGLSMRICGWRNDSVDDRIRAAATAAAATPARRTCRSGSP